MAHLLNNIRIDRSAVHQETSPDKERTLSVEFHRLKERKLIYTYLAGNALDESFRAAACFSKD